MTGSRDRDYLLGLVQELLGLPHETEWVEFKTNQRDPHTIGKHVSALANAAALHGKATSFSPGVAVEARLTGNSTLTLRVRPGDGRDERDAVLRFHALMDRLMPQWRAHRDVLNRRPLAHEEWGHWNGLCLQSRMGSPTPLCS